uniref:RNA-directed DNA polymerase, eukaryota n=1 Tax=Tanacetum cinerariifolium TaxID=118510 RepID=A0A6L2M390_TANCI|nr:RNA-directed DNA polymerase, eukaryota [Tanacetum cinerariifolium]
MGDFNEVRSESKRFASVFNPQGASAFNNFISSAGLIDLPLEGYSFTWAHKSASMMSKLDCFLISEGLIELFSHLSATCLDGNLSDHRPIPLPESIYDYGPSPFRFFHSWFIMKGFDSFVENTWKSLTVVEDNGLIRLKKKLQALKYAIKEWSKEAKKKSTDKKLTLQHSLLEIDKLNDRGMSNEEILNKKRTLVNELQEINSKNAIEISQKSKIYVFMAIKELFVNGYFPRGCNFSFIALIPKIQDAKYAFDSVKYDYLDETLKAFGFGQKWCRWINGCLNNAMGWSSYPFKVDAHLDSTLSLSIYMAPMGVLNKLESARQNFFNGIDGSNRNTTWIGWNKVLASKKNGGFGF